MTQNECLQENPCFCNTEVIFNHLQHYFDYHVFLSIRPFVLRPFILRLFVLRVSQNIFLLKTPWNHSLTPGVDPWGGLLEAPGHAAPPEALEYACKAGIF